MKIVLALCTYHEYYVQYKKLNSILEVYRNKESITARSHLLYRYISNGLTEFKIISEYAISPHKFKWQILHEFTHHASYITKIDALNSLIETHFITQFKIQSIKQTNMTVPLIKEEGLKGLTNSAVKPRDASRMFEIPEDILILKPAIMR